MKKILQKALSVILHPVIFYRAQKRQEQMMLLALAALYSNIEDPNGYDVDKLHEEMNSVLEIMHNYPHVIDEFPEMKHDLFWCKLLSKFFKLEVAREDVKATIDVYSYPKGHLDDYGIKPTIVNASNTLICLMKNWSYM